MAAADTDYLLKQQYRDASNLGARAQLHAKFSTNRLGWHRWAFERLALPPDARVLELGCVPAWSWRDNRERIPSGWSLVLTDSWRAWCPSSGEAPCSWTPPCSLGPCAFFPMAFALSRCSQLPSAACRCVLGVHGFCIPERQGRGIDDGAC